MVAAYQGASATPQVGGGTATSVILDRTAGTIGTVATGDILFANINIEASAISGVTMPTGWTLKTASTTGFLSVIQAWKRATGSEPSTYTFGWTGGGWTSGTLIRFNGATATGDPFGTYVLTPFASATTPSVAYTAGVTGLGLWIYNGLNDGLTVTPPTGYAMQFTAVHGDFTVATRTDTAGSKTTGTGTTSASNTAILLAGLLSDSGTTPNVAPTINAGSDQTVAAGATVTLAATAADSDGTVTSVDWTQLTGPTVTLAGTGTSRTFTAPAVAGGTVLTFRATATDNAGATGTDDITVTVAAPPAPIADAGLNRTVEPWIEVFLDGTGSVDTTGTATYTWTQLSSPHVQMYGLGIRQSFYAPASINGLALAYRLTATSAGGVSTSDVSVNVAPASLRIPRNGRWVPKQSLELGTEQPNVVSAPASTLVSNFGTLDGFTAFGGVGPTISGNRLNLPAETGYPTVASVARFDLTNSSITARLVQAPNIVAAGSTQTWLELFDSTGNAIQFGWFNGGVFANQSSGGVVVGSTVAYVSGTDVWFRISHDGTNVVWATSPDKTTWTAKRTVAPTVALTRLQVLIHAGNFTEETAPGVAIWDSLNI